MLFDVDPVGVTVGAQLNSAPKTDNIAARIEAFEKRLWDEADADIAAAIANDPSPTRTYEFTGATKFLNDYRASLKREWDIRDRDQSAVGTERIDSQVGVAINEYVLDKIVSRFGNIHKSGRTGRKSVLDVVRGFAGYELRVGSVDITVSSAGITGSTPVNVFAGLYYQYKVVDDCSWKWGDEKKIGLGVKGKPKVTLRTRSSSGLSVRADFDLGGLKIYTGAGFPIDDLLDLLSPLFMGALEAILDTIALGISFVVIPVKIAIPGQATVIQFSQFTTGQWNHPQGGTTSQNNYAMFATTLTPK
jgi:hypothetical protein